jgi:endoglucanase
VRVNQKWVLLLMLAAFFGSAQAYASESWPLWEAFKLRFIDGQGRVVDHDGGDRTTSEGQSYAMFFALVAGDRITFDRLLAWIEQNLAGGDLKSHLPAWLWGRAGDGNWRVLDQNSASDADLWLSYTLLQASGLWDSEAYEALGHAIANRVAAEEVAIVPGLGAMLLPGARGFHPSRNVYIFNASYLPPQLIWNLSAHQPEGPWSEIGLNVPKVVNGSRRDGWVLDWIAYEPGEGFQTRPLSQTQAKASYDAIRVYLWAGLLNDKTFEKKKILSAVSTGMVPYLREHPIPPASVNEDGAVEQTAGNVGFSAAMVPLLRNLGEDTSAAAQQRRMAAEWDATTGLYGRPGRYYDQCLALFAAGWMDQRFSFDATGALETGWKF